MPSESILEGREILLGVSGSIAAFKACALASLLVKEGARVQPVLTRGGARFITPESLAALCSRPVLMDAFDTPDQFEMTHIAAAERADVVVLAPASANLIGRIAAGLCNDMLTLLLTVTQAPVLLAPAMNTNMWRHPIISANINALVRLGYTLVEPGSGRLACGTVGPGKLAEPEEIAEAIRDILRAQRGRPRDLEGLRFLVTAGPTREPIDGVRFIGNRSSGKMGYALAEAAIARGASVTLVSGPTSIPVPAGVRAVRVETASEMRAAVLEHVTDVDVVVAAAAVGDYTVKDAPTGKIRRGAGPLVLTLEPTTDILREISLDKGKRIHVGFAAEVGDPIPGAWRKLLEKNVDMVVANDVSVVGSGFETDTNVVTLVRPTGEPERLPLLTKREVADRILDAVKIMNRAER